MLDLIIRAVAHLLIPLFFVGMAGSTIVVAVTFLHDIFEFFEEEPPIPETDGKR